MDSYGINNQIGLPPAQDALGSSLSLAILTIQQVMNEMVNFVATFIQSDFGRNFSITIVLFGLIFFTIVAILLFSIVPRRHPHKLPHTPYQVFLARHEVGLTNVTLFFLGSGFALSFILLVFYPSVTSIVLLTTYMVVLVLRGFGFVGSYDSVFRSKSGESLFGKGIRVIDFHTKEEIGLNIISEISQVHLSVPYTGVFYLKIMTQNGEVDTNHFRAHKGHIRRRFDI